MADYNSQFTGEQIDAAIRKMNSGALIGGGNVPAGGTAGQVLTKLSDVDFDAAWGEGGGGGGGYILPAATETKLGGIMAAPATDEYTEEIKIRNNKLYGKPGGKTSSEFTISLPSTGWANNVQTITDARFVAAGFAYIIAPSGNGIDAYAAFEVYADDITADGSITFHCTTAPTVDITINVLKVGVQ